MSSMGASLHRINSSILSRSNCLTQASRVKEISAPQSFTRCLA